MVRTLFVFSARLAFALGCLILVSCSTLRPEIRRYAAADSAGILDYVIAYPDRSV